MKRNQVHYLPTINPNLPECYFSGVKGRMKKIVLFHLYPGIYLGSLAQDSMLRLESMLPPFGKLVSLSYYIVSKEWNDHQSTSSP